MNHLSRTIVLFIALTCTLCAVILGQRMARQTQGNQDEQKRLRTALRDCQFEESLEVYGHPQDFDESIFTRCFVPASKGGEAILQVETSVQNLLDKGWHYSTEESANKKSKNEEFVFLEVTIFPQGDVAEVRTRERWYLLMVDEDDHIVVERKPRMEYEVTYTLVKMAGKWLIQTNSTPRPRS